MTKPVGQIKGPIGPAVSPHRCHGGTYQQENSSEVKMLWCVFEAPWFPFWCGCHFFIPFSSDTAELRILRKKKSWQVWGNGRLCLKMTSNTLFNQTTTPDIGFYIWNALYYTVRKPSNFREFYLFYKYILKNFVSFS